MEETPTPASSCTSRTTASSRLSPCSTKPLSAVYMPDLKRLTRPRRHLPPQGDSLGREDPMLLEEDRDMPVESILWALPARDHDDHGVGARVHPAAARGVGAGALEASLDGAGGLAAPAAELDPRVPLRERHGLPRQRRVFHRGVEHERADVGGGQAGGGQLLHRRAPPGGHVHRVPPLPRRALAQEVCFEMWRCVGGARARGRGVGDPASLKGPPVRGHLPPQPERLHLAGREPRHARRAVAIPFVRGPDKDLAVVQQDHQGPREGLWDERRALFVAGAPVQGIGAECLGREDHGGREGAAVAAEACGAVVPAQRRGSGAGLLLAPDDGWQAAAAGRTEAR
mmetsp:Transcript_54315/g.172486  ORF Transcript_54315/g.172486 Transcript_54315/m.172486 type:complete len:342 (-) Transcript_54315:138-1163(-)